MPKIVELRAFLRSASPGPIANKRKLIEILTDCWHEFDGGSDTSMTPGKLDRIEEPNWRPPVLSFSIERHGQTVRGSKRATCYEWAFDLDKLTAKIAGQRPRQLTPNDKRLLVRPLAKEIAQAILERANDERLKIMRDGRVKVEIGAVIPETNAQTTTGRRRRFRRELTSLLEPHGWKEVRANIYSRSDDKNSKQYE